MTDQTDSNDQDNVIATIKNKDDPNQVIAIKYFQEENAFVTSGIETNLGEKDFMIPAHLVALDLERIGTILSAILEKISQAHERDTSFDYVSNFEVLGKTYRLTEHGDFMKLEEV